MLNFSSTFFLFIKIYKKYFLSFKILWKIFLNIFSRHGLPEHSTVMFHMTVVTHEPKWVTSGPTRGLADPTGRPPPGNLWVGPTFSNDSIAIVAGLPLHVHAVLLLNRGRGGGVKLSCSLFHSLTHSLPLTNFALRFSLDFGTSLVSRNLSLSFLCCKIVHTLRGTTFR